MLVYNYRITDSGSLDQLIINQGDPKTGTCLCCLLDQIIHYGTSISHKIPIRPNSRKQLLTFIFLQIKAAEMTTSYLRCSISVNSNHACGDRSRSYKMHYLLNTLSHISIYPI